MRVFPCLPLISPSLLRWRFRDLPCSCCSPLFPQPTASSHWDQMPTKTRANTDKVAASASCHLRFLACVSRLQVDWAHSFGGTVRMPGNPWIFSRSELPAPGAPAFQGEHNEEILKE